RRKSSPTKCYRNGRGNRPGSRCGRFSSGSASRRSRSWRSSRPSRSVGSPLAHHWTLDPKIDFLNHGSFGACPRPLLEAQAELRATDHAYTACRNALRWHEKHGAKVVVAAVPWPIAGPAQVTDAVLGSVTPRTRLVLLDQVTSPTGLVFPVDQIVGRLNERGI